MELNKAFHLAVILAWQDLSRVTPLCLTKVEYACEPGRPLEHLNVWLVRVRGYEDLVCDYATRASADHPGGVSFKNGHSSHQLAHALEFIMKNQDHFTRGADASRNGLVLIYPPTDEERTEAAAWISRIQSLANSSGKTVDEKVPLTGAALAELPRGDHALSSAILGRSS